MIGDELPQSICWCVVSDKDLPHDPEEVEYGAVLVLEVEIDDVVGQLEVLDDGEDGIGWLRSFSLEELQHLGEHLDDLEVGVESLDWF
jgi:hypothetical protein